MILKVRIISLTFLWLTVWCGIGLCSDGYYEVSAEQRQSVACQLEDDSGSAGHITFMFKPPAGIESGLIEFNGLFLDHTKKYHAIIHKIKITKVVDFENGSYTFEGIDESIGGGEVRGQFKNPQDFEINGYFSKSFSSVDCIYYRITPFKSTWAKKIARDNPKFKF